MCHWVKSSPNSMVLPIKGHLLITFLFVISTRSDVGAFLFDTDPCTRYAEYKDLISLAHVENCLSIDKVFTKLKSLGDKDRQCLNHVLDQLGDRYGVSVQKPEDCQCNGTNSLVDYQINVHDGTSDNRRRCLSIPNYKALFDQFFVDQGNKAPACRSHHSLWFNLSRIRDVSCAQDLMYHVKYSFDHHPSPCVCQQSLQYGDPNNCLQFHSYQDLLKLKDTNLCTSKNSQWDLLHDLEIRSPACRKNITMDLAIFFRNPLSQNPCSCHHDMAISNDISSLEDGKRIECSNVHGSSYSGLRQELFGGASNAGCETHFHLWQKLQDIRPFQSYDCTMDLILRTANKYPSAKSDPCTCTGELPTTSSSTTKTTTTHTTTTTTRTTTTTTTTVSPFPPNRFRCRKYELIADIAIGNHVHTNGSTPCESKLSGTNEDLVISLCNMTSVETWSRGAQVMSSCEVIPSYSPVATFSLAGKYQPLDSQSGVFLECLGSDGFKMIIQSCNGGPQIIHVQTTGVFNNNATIYYAVV